MDIYKIVTDKIIAELEKGIIPWDKPWTGTQAGAISYTTGKPYSFINQLLLGEPGEYITFKQCVSLGGKVKKGAKAKQVIFWKILEKDKRDITGKPVVNAQGETEQINVPYLQYYNVFHIKDCEGIESKRQGITPTEFNPVDEAERIIDDYIKREKVTITYKAQNRAYYNYAGDFISLPLREQFKSVEAFYNTYYHETIHSTGHEKRLNRRDSNQVAFGDETYSKEELVAEIGSAVLMHQTNLENKESTKNSAAYIQSWLRALKDDKTLIVTSAGKAEKAVNLILNKQPQPQP